MTQPERSAEIVNTQNDFMVSSRAVKRIQAPDAWIIVLTCPVICRTRQEAYRLAAYLITMGDILGDESGAHDWEEVLNAVRNT